MDTSETYIKMADCEEIQDLSPPNVSDDGRFLFFNNGDYKYVRYGAFFNNEGFSKGGKVIWLPRQDQLQEMLNLKVAALWASFSEWLTDKCVLEDSDLLYTVDSMEQLWLAFIMAEKYNKCWDGEKWLN